MTVKCINLTVLSCPGTGLTPDDVTPLSTESGNDSVEVTALPERGVVEGD